MSFNKKLSIAIVSVVLLLTGLPLAAQSVERNPLPVPDVNGYKTLKADFHLHTVFSDGRVWPEVRVVEAYQQGLDVIALTDHDDYHPWKDYVSEDISKPYELAKPLAGQLGIILIPGVEITKGEWHFNALFMKDFNATKGLDKREALIVAKQQGAYVFWNHPGWKRPERWFPEIDPLWDSQLFSGVELVNGRSVYDGIYKDITTKKLAIIATSDAHMPITADQIEGRPITLIFAKTADPEGIRDALDNRRTAAWMGGEVWGDQEFLSALWDGAINIENTRFTARQGGRGGIRLTNTSALEFQITDAHDVAWLSLRPTTLAPQKGAGLQLTVAPNAPAGTHDVQLEMEIKNFHIAPAENLKVALPIQVTVNPKR